MNEMLQEQQDEFERNKPNDNKQSPQKKEEPKTYNEKMTQMQNDYKAPIMDFNVSKPSAQVSVNNTLDAIESDPEMNKEAETLTNNETGEVNIPKTKSALEQYEKSLVELGAGEIDLDGNFKLKPTGGKGWEHWATMLSVGLSVLGIALGVPIVPINFKKLTGKAEVEEQLRKLQEQYTDIQAKSADSVSGMESDIEAGELALNNQNALAAQEKHAQATAAQKDVINAQTGSQKDIIDKQTESTIKIDDNAVKNRLQELKANQDFQLKFADLNNTFSKEIAQLQSDLAKDQAMAIQKYQNAGWIADLKQQAKDLGMSMDDIAVMVASTGGSTSLSRGIGYLADGVGAITSIFKGR